MTTPTLPLLCLSFRDPSPELFRLPLLRAARPRLHPLYQTLFRPSFVAQLNNTKHRFANLRLDGGGINLVQILRINSRRNQEKTPCASGHQGADALTMPTTMTTTVRDTPMHVRNVNLVVRMKAMRNVRPALSLGILHLRSRHESNKASSTTTPETYHRRASLLSVQPLYSHFAERHLRRDFGYPSSIRSHIPLNHLRSSP